jgi:hypothetical protein
MKEGEEGKETMIMLNTKFNVGQNKRGQSLLGTRHRDENDK